MSKKVTSKIIAIIGVILLILILRMVVYGLQYGLNREKSPLTADDYKVIVTAHELQEYYDDFYPSDEYVQSYRSKYIDDSLELNYKYIPNEDDQPSIISRVKIEKDKEEADQTFWAFMKGMEIGLPKKIELEEDNDFYNYGEKSKFFHLYQNSLLVGHYFTTQVDNKVFVFLIIGYLLDEDLCIAVLDEKLDNLAEFNISN